MSWYDDKCDEHGPLVERQCSKCPTKEALIASGDFYGLACRIFDEQDGVGSATKASYIGEAMKQCYEAGRANALPEEAWTKCDRPYADCTICLGSGDHGGDPCGTCIWRRWFEDNRGNIKTPEEIDAERAEP